MNINNISKKELNSICSCGIGLICKETDIIMLEPCEHLLHINCLSNKNCPLCNSEIKYIFSLENLKSLKHIPYFYQKYIDIYSITNFNKLSLPINYYNIIPNISKLIDLSTKMVFSSVEDNHDIVGSILSINNLKLIINGRENILNSKKVIISNHITDYDTLFLFYIFKCGILYTTNIFNTPCGHTLARTLPMIFVNRGKKTSNTVNKMKSMVEKVGSILVFPEGFVRNPSTIAKFRTGAFYIDYPVQPVVIKYEPIIYDSSPIDFLLKLMSCDKLTITVNILPPEYPPFNANKIENIREKMAECGNMALSRVSNRDKIDNVEIPQDLINGYYPNN